MDRVLGHPPTVLRNEKSILAVEETTSAGRYGSSLVAFSRPASACRYDSLTRGVFLSL